MAVEHGEDGRDSPAILLPTAMLPGPVSTLTARKAGQGTSASWSPEPITTGCVEEEVQIEAVEGEAAEHLRHRAERKAAYKADPIVQCLVSSNSIAVGDFVDGSPKALAHLEMCHFNYPRIGGLHLFGAHLRSLSIYAQELDCITGLAACTALERLWVCETRVAEIQGLAACTQLRELYLCSNRIQRIQGLEGLEELRKLALSDNQITHITGLEGLGRLEELQLGNNRIHHLHNAFPGNSGLRRLNISGNRITHFDDLISLSHLPALTHLWLEDPNFERNAVCSLSNYQTYLIHALPRLQRLDTIDITPAYRAVVEDIFDKKIMYYNMRMRTIARNVHFLMNLLENEHSFQLTEAEGFRDRVVQRMKMLRRVLHDVGILEAFSGDAERAKEITDKVEGAMRGLLEQATAVEGAICTRTKHKEALFRLLRAARHLSSHKVFLELESGGNVRFEDLDQARLPEELANLLEQFRSRTQALHPGHAVEVLRMAKITSKKVVLPPLEASEPPVTSASISRRPASKTTTEASGEATTSASLSRSYCILVDGPGCARLFRHLDPNVTPNGPNTSAPGTPGVEEEGGSCIPCYDHFPFPPSEEEAVMVQGLLCSYPHFGTAGSLQFNVAGVAQLKGAGALRAARLTPEYVCEVYAARAEGSTPLTPHLERPILKFAYSTVLVHGDLPELSVRAIFGRTGDPAPDLVPTAEKANVLANFTPRKWAEVDEAYPILSFLEKTLILAPESYDDLPADHATMHLCPANLGQLKKLSRFTALRSLSLVSLQLDAIPSSLAECPLLEELDLSFNQIQTIHGCLQANPRLHTMDLYANDISCVGDLDTGLLALRDLNLRSNPITKRNSYRLSLHVLYPWLERLDAMPFAPPPPLPATVTAELLLRNSLPSEQLYPSFASRTHYCQSVAEQRAHYLLHHTISGESQALEGIVVLELDRCRLLSLDGMPDRLPNLRKASFKQNLLCNVDKLAHYRQLEELFLESNEIDSINALCVLAHLRLLDLTDNQITVVKFPSAMQMPAFASLRCLCLEKNYIQHCDFLSAIQGLQDVYLGNNLLVQEPANIYSLKRLPNLVILDLSNNPLCEIDQFRLFTVYHLSKLKVLNGTILSPKDLAEARTKFAGKLTFELLKEKIGVSQVRNLTELDLQNCKLKEMACFLSGDFRNLRRLNLDNNLIDSMDGFRSLHSLQSLSLNNNRIEVMGREEGSAGCGGIEGASPVPVTMPALSSSDFPYLEDLRLGYNNVARISDLHLGRLSKLKVLHLQGNKISRLEGLDSLSGLQELVLDKNHIREAEPSSFFSLINLKSLHLRENRIRTLSHFNCLPNLRYLYLSSNRLQETGEVEKMNLPSLIDVSFIGNSIARKLLYRILVINRFPQILFIDGKEVSEEELERARIYGLEIHRTQFPEMPFYSSQSPGASSALSSTTTLALQPSSSTSSSSTNLSSYGVTSTSASVTSSYSNLGLAGSNVSLAGNGVQTFQYTTRGGAMKLSSVLLDGSQMGLRSSSSNNNHRRK